MSGLPSISGADAVKALGRIGFEQVGQKGSHVKLRSGDGNIVIVPMHKELKRGTIQSKSILRQAGIGAGEFAKLLR